MTITFLVAVTIDDLSAITDVAADIEEDLLAVGHAVESVKPWTRQQQQNPLSVLPAVTEILPPPTQI